MYHYAGNNPVRYVDPDGRVTAIVYANKRFADIERSELKNWIDRGCPNYNPKIKATLIDLEDSSEYIDKLATKFSVVNLHLPFSTKEQMKYVDDEKRIYKKIQALRLQDEKNIKITNSLIEEASKLAERKYSSIKDIKELTNAEKMKIAEDFANESLEKKIDSLLNFE